ncbi:MAG: sugar metabolism transcriptional regulator [Pirellula sp.]|nr:sugar metabolism transcriptional regulator [Pirellula sp.]
MLYQRSLDIEDRLMTVLQLIESGHYSTPELAKAVGVSIPTMSRDITALRQRGYSIMAEREDNTWHYMLEGEAKRSQIMRRRPR